MPWPSRPCPGPGGTPVPRCGLGQAPGRPVVAGSPTSRAQMFAKRGSACPPAETGCSASKLDGVVLTLGLRPRSCRFGICLLPSFCEIRHWRERIKAVAATIALQAWLRRQRRRPHQTPPPKTGWVTVPVLRCPAQASLTLAHDGEQLHLEYEHSVGSDVSACATLAIGKLRGDKQLPL